MNRNLRIVLLIVVFGISMLAIRWYFYPTPRQALPLFGSTEVMENNPKPSFHGDYSYRLKAKVSHDGFLSFVKRLRITRVSGDKDRHLKTFWEPEEEWFQPKPSVEGTYFEDLQSENFLRMAKYEEGYLFYYETQW